MVPATPELVAIPLHPVTGEFGLCQIRPRRGRLLNLEGGGFLDPGRGENLAVLPNALLQVELAELGQAGGWHTQAPSARIDAARTSFPSHALDAQRLEQA